MNGRIYGFVIAMLIVLTGCAGPRPVDEISLSGHQSFNRGNYLRAAQEFEEITERYPGDWRAQYMLGRSRLALGEISAARRALEVARTRRPADPDIADAIAQTMLAAGDEQALFGFLRQRAQSNQSPDDYMRLARYCMELGDPDSARLALDTAIELDEGRSAAPYVLAADLAERVGDRQRAVDRLRQASGIEPGNPKIAERLRTMGEIPGPTNTLPPGN